MTAHPRNCLSVLLLALAATAANGSPAKVDDRMTGEILTLLYVSDVRESVAFYDAVGFDHYFYYDYEADEYVLDWIRPYPPEYAEMTRGSIRIGLTTADGAEPVYGGGVRHYFMVTDVASHFAEAHANGIVAEPDEVEVRPWMSFFTLADPDGHQIVFGEKNQAYYDRIAEQLMELHARHD